MAHKESILQKDTTMGIEMQKSLWLPNPRTSNELQRKKRNREGEESDENNDSDKWPSGSKWQKIHLAALHILVGPVEQNNVIPEAFLPTDEEMEKLSELWKFSEQQIREEKFEAKNPLVDKFWMKLAELVRRLEGSYNEEDKDEEFSVPALNALLECFDEIDTTKGYLRLKPKGTNRVYITPSITATVILDGSLQFKNGNKVALGVWNEAKRKKTSQAHESEVAQKGAEMLAVLQRNYLQNETKKPQEAFGIGIKHSSISFYHSFVTTDYLDALLLKSEALPEGLCMELKRFPKETAPYNLINPVHLKEVVRCLLAIIKYMKSGKAMGRTRAQVEKGQK